MTRTTLQATSDFYASSPGIRLFRLALGASERLWPSLAVRAAYRLFGTPLPPKWLHRRKAWDETWRIENWAFEDAGITLYSQPVAPHGPVVLLAPGWGGFAQQMLPLAQALAAQGLRPVIVEMPAHGRSPGTVSNLPQFARVLEYVHARLQQEGHTVRAVAAHSLSANAAAYAAARGLPVQRLVLLAPPASPREYTRLFAGVFGLSETTRAAMQKLIEAREGILMSQFEPASVGPRIGAPTLIMHDREDRVNLLADGKAFAEALPQGRLVVTEGLGHRRILKDEDVLRHVTTFVTS